MNKKTGVKQASSFEQPRHIRSRLIVTFVILLVGAMVVATVSLLWLRVDDIQERLIGETLVKANTIATQIAPSLEFAESSQAQAILSHFSSDPSVHAIKIENLSGEVFATFGSMQIPTGLNQNSNLAFNSDGLWVRIPVIVDSVPAGTVLLQASLSELQTEVWRSLLTSILIMAVVVLLTVLLMLKAIRVITRPISSLARTAAEISVKGDFSLRATKFANDEIGVLADEFNLMLDTIEQQNIELEKQHNRFAISERLESLGLLAGGVAHDLNNILGPLVAMPDLILTKLEKDHEATEGIKMISKASRRAAVVIQDLLSLARRGTYVLEAVDLNEIVRECIASPAVQQRLADAPGGRCQLLLSDSLRMSKGSEPHLTQLVLNLAINAIEAMSQSDAKGEVVIRSKNVLLKQAHEAYETIPAGEYTMLSVKDQGPGMSTEAMKRIFEPFYTSKKLGSSGSGLGLSVVYGVVHDHGGFLDVISKPGQGAEFRIYLRVDDTIKFAEEVDSLIEMDARILVVDDLDTQLYLTESLLQSIGYRAISASGGRQALKILREDADIDLMIVDMIMEEGFDGLDTIREALKLKPTLPCIIATGFSETDRVKSALALGALACLNKPYTVEELSKVVNRALKDNMRQFSGAPISGGGQQRAVTMETVSEPSKTEIPEQNAAAVTDTGKSAAEQRVVVRDNSSGDPAQPTILVVDDDPDIREIAVESISRLGFNVVGAATAAEVLAWLLTTEQTPALVLSDMNMPGGITGLDIAGKVQEAHPDCKVIIMSGQSALDISDYKHPIKGLQFLAKPFSLSALNRKIQEVLSSS